MTSEGRASWAVFTVISAEFIASGGVSLGTLHSSILIDIFQVRRSKFSKCLRVLRVQLYLATVYTKKYHFGAEGVSKSLGVVLDDVPR